MIQTSFYKLSIASAAWLVFSIVVASSLPIARADSSDSQTGERYNYPPDVVDTYIKDCTKNAIESEVPQERAEALCRCMINRFQAQLPLEKFKQLTRDASEGEESADVLIDIALSCFEEIDSER